MDTRTQTALERAVELFETSGGVAGLAGACKVSPQAVYQWLKKGYPPTFDRCKDVERATGGRVSRFDLLPP